MSAESFNFPGVELDPSKPWLRRVDDQVVRYVRGAVEGPVIRNARRLLMPNEFDVILCERGQQLLDELDELRENYGLNIPPTSFEPAEVPVFAKELVLGKQRGLKVTTGYVEGQEVGEGIQVADKSAFVAAAKAVHEGLSDYMVDRTHSGDEFLPDVFKIRQWLFNPAGVELSMVDTDPMFLPPTQTVLIGVGHDLQFGFSTMLHYAHQG